MVRRKLELRAKVRISVNHSSKLNMGQRVNHLSRLLLVCIISALVLPTGGCSGAAGGTNHQQPPVTPTVTVTPSSGTITSGQSLDVTIVVSATGGTPTGSVTLSSGSYSSSASTLASGKASIAIPAGSLASGTDTLTATYTPDSASASSYSSASGAASVTVTSPLVTPTVTVTPSSTNISTTQSLAVSITVSGPSGTPTGSVVLASGSYSSAAVTLSSGKASITIPAGSLSAGSDTLTATYTPDSGSSSTYSSASGSASITAAAGSSTAVSVNINVLSNRHEISPYIYGGNLNDLSNVSDSGTTWVRWGGNQASTYNWKLHTYNSAADYYFEDFGIGGSDPDSVQFVKDAQSDGANVITTIPMLSWVAKAAENSSNGNWSFSVSKYGAQCKVDPYNSDAGDGLQADCKTPVTSSPVTTAYYPLVDTPSECPAGTVDGTTCLDRETWVKALASAFGSGTCAVPYSSITSCHFYDMDNEPGIWSGTHMDVHPVASGYDELANDFEHEASLVKTWDPAAVRFGPVSCCWWFYWNVGPKGDDRASHAGVDFLPWWLNQIYWMDQIHGSRTLDVFDVHAYANANTSGLTKAQLQALAISVYRDYWDPTYVSTSGTINQQYATMMEPSKTIPFRIPRLKAMVNAIYPGTPLSFTEWSAAFAGESDFSTAVGDAEAYGIFGREGLSFASRWGGPTKGNPNYLALKLYTNYDGAHHGFGTISVSDQNSGDPNLFSSYAALNASGTQMTIMVINGDPSKSDQVNFNLSGFQASSYTAYTLDSTDSSAISASGSQAWSSTQTFAPYSITLLVVSGSEVNPPVSEWHLNPGDLMIPAGGTATLHPAITSGSANVTLNSAVFDSYEGAAACSGSLTLTNATATPSKPGTITVDAGSTPGFCHYTVTGSDGTVTQMQGGWIVVGNPAATLTPSGSNQSGAPGATLSQPLTVKLDPGQSGGTNTGAGILFTTSAGTLSNGTTTGTKVIATTDSSGIASVTLTLPASAGTVTVTAQDMFALGGASVSFTETAN